MKSSIVSRLHEMRQVASVITPPHFLNSTSSFKLAFTSESTDLTVVAELVSTPRTSQPQIRDFYPKVLSQPPSESPVAFRPTACPPRARFIICNSGSKLRVKAGLKETS
jgi:hypothetical protein